MSIAIERDLLSQAGLKPSMQELLEATNIGVLEYSSFPRAIGRIFDYQDPRVIITDSDGTLRDTLEHIKNFKPRQIYKKWIEALGYLSSTHQIIVASNQRLEVENLSLALGPKDVFMPEAPVSWGFKNSLGTVSRLAKHAIDSRKIDGGLTVIGDRWDRDGRLCLQVHNQLRDQLGVAVETEFIKLPGPSCDEKWTGNFLP